MDYCLIFDHTGDRIPLQSINDDVLCYFVANLNGVNSNHFANQNHFADQIDQYVERLDHLVQKVSGWPREIRPFTYDDLGPGTWLDQPRLCRLHTLWARRQRVPIDIQHLHREHQTKLTQWIIDQYPDNEHEVSFGDLLQKLQWSDQYDDINHTLHCIEMAYERIQFYTADRRWIEFDNPFGPAVTTNDTVNFALNFNHLGRPCYGKYAYNDTDFEDENSFDQLIAALEIRIKQPETIGYSPEYVSYCQQHNKTPSGLRIGLGNIPDLSNRFGFYRSMLLHNIRMKNSFSIQL